MKWTLRVTAIILLALIAVFVWRIVLPLVGYGFAEKRALSADREFLLKEVDHQAVASACLDLMTKPEYKALLGQSPLGDDPRLPAAIRAVKSFWVSVNANNVMIMKTGGFYHMGYIFRPSVSESNRYDLVFREEKDLEHEISLSSVRRE